MCVLGNVQPYYASLQNPVKLEANLPKAVYAVRVRPDDVAEHIESLEQDSVLCIHLLYHS